MSTNGPVAPGQAVVITGIDGLTLYVRPLAPPAAPPSEEGKTIPLADA